MSNGEQQRLVDLLIEPAETPEVEIKSWVNPDEPNDRASIAKALIALANHGGGYLIFGHSRLADGNYVPAAPRPNSLDSYNTDTINGIIARFAEPEFHCATYFVRNGADGELYPVVRVPGGHTVPIRAKRDGPNRVTSQGTYYIRRPGPKSEAPQSGREWDELIRRCVQQQREALLDAFRTILGGNSLPTPADPDETPQLSNWAEESMERWREVTRDLPLDTPARFPNGHYRVSYLVLGGTEVPTLPQLLHVLDQSVSRYSGWPPFWVPSRQEIAPYAVDGALECWMAPEHSSFPDAAHADFWRAEPNGKMFLIRGFQEDSGESSAAAGAYLDVALPIYRMGECLMHAARFAERLAGREAEVMFQVRYTGLAGRALTSLSGRRSMFSERIAKADTFENTMQVTVTQIQDNLPEVLRDLLANLYVLFDLFELTANLVQDVVNEMKGNARSSKY